MLNESMDKAKPFGRGQEQAEAMLGKRNCSRPATKRAAPGSSA
jgi:hypothetical protein